MQDIFGSVRRSLVFRQNPQTDGPGDRGGGAGAGIVDKIGSCLRRSRVGMGGLGGLGFLPRLQSPTPPSAPPTGQTPSTVRDGSPTIRWRKGELIGCGAFGHVYMGMNLDSGELLAVKQVLIGSSNASKQKAQDNIRELEEEVKLLKNLSHPNIVRYLGTAREEETLNILLEFVPGGSISSLLGKFGSFPESVIRMYTKQLLQGLEYLHQNGIIHRDIKGANILVDNKGCIKLADFGASKQVAKLATMNAAKSMKGTPYWMAPEVIVQTGHSFSADIWSVGCTVIEMATGKPPWSQQYQEVAVLYHIGTTKSHPPIPEHLSLEAKDFLLKCLQKEPNLRPTASDLLQHPFVTGENGDTHLLCRSSGMKPSSSVLQASGCDLKNSQDPVMRPTAICEVVRNVDDIDGRRCSIYHEKLFSARPIWEMDNSDEMCRLDDTNDLLVIGQSFNPMSEPFDGDWSCKFNKSLEEQIRMDSHDFDGSVNDAACTSGKGENDFTFPCRPTCEDDDEVTETKIRAFLDEKAQDLKKLQTPLYEFYNTMNASKSQCIVSNISEENVVKNSKLPPKSKLSPSGVGSGVSTPPANAGSSGSPGILKEIPSPWINEWEGRIEDAEPKPTGPINSFSERRRKWKEELDQELQSKREMLRQAGVGGRTSSPNDKCLNRKASLLKIVSTGK